MSMKYKLLLCVVVLLAVSATAVLAAPVTIYQQTFTPKNAQKADTDPLKYTKWTYTGDWTVTDQSHSASAKPGVPLLPANEPVVDSNGDPTGAFVNNALVYNKLGDYGPSLNYRVVSLPINCTGKTSVVLSFNRSLTIEDAAFDQATVEVSKDGTTWAPAWKTAAVNPTDPTQAANKHDKNLLDPAWTAVSYDISGTADNQSKVYLRFGIITNSTNTNGGRLSTPLTGLHGWAIDDITLTGAGPDAFYVATPTGASLGDNMVADPADGLWMAGPAVAGGGQVRYKDPGDHSAGTQTVGQDPGTNAAGAAGGEIIGTMLAPLGTTPTWASPDTHVGGNQQLFNYPPGISPDGTVHGYSAAAAPNNTFGPQYLTWGGDDGLDLTGLQKTALSFQRWLNIGAGSLDKIAIQVHVSDPDLDEPMDPAVIVDLTTAKTANVGTPKVVWGIDTTERYTPLTIKFKYNTDTFADANAEALRFQYTLDNSVDTPTWVTFVGTGKGGGKAAGDVDVINGTVTVNTPNDDDNKGVESVTFGGTNFASVPDYVRAQDNKNFAVRVVLSKNDAPTYSALADASTAKVVVSEVKAMGVIWNYVWTNAKTSPSSEIMDTAWTAVSYDLSAFGADDNEHVWVRWSINKSDSGFYTEYGGWNLDQIAIVENSRQWKAGTEGVPANGLIWGQTGGVTVPAKNTGTATWDDSYSLYEVKGVTTQVPDPGAPLTPSKKLNIVSVDEDISPINRWAVDSVDVSGTVAPDATYTFNPTVKAPPLSSVVYDLTLAVTAPASPDLSVLDADWDMANATADSDNDWLPTFMGTSIANKGIATGRYSDITPPSSRGYWAKYWIEELSGRVPMVVQGYGDGTYRPNPNPAIVGDTTGQITRDQIAVFMARATGILPYAGTGAVFSDVPSNYWAVNEIEACFVNHIVSGFPDLTYQPLGTIARDAMAKFVANGKKLVDASFKIPTVASMTADPFIDVPRKDDSTKTPPIKANVFANFIQALKDADIVQGYPSGKDADGNTIWTYRPAVIVTRDQLAVYVWRAFMRDDASIVVLGGPAITGVEVSTDGDAPDDVAGYYGYKNAGSAFTTGPFLGDTAHSKKAYVTRLVKSSALDYAYVTFDAVRFTADPDSVLGGNDNLDVSFQLTRVTGTTGPAVAAGLVQVPAVQVGQWFLDVTDPDLNVTGEPYRNAAWAIPTGLMGDFTLVCKVEGVTLAAQPAFSIRGDLGYDETFDDVARLSYWPAYGQPASPGPRIYPLSYSTDDVSASVRSDTLDKLYHDDGSLELTQTQAVLRLFPTTGHHNIRIGLCFAQAGFGSTDSIKIEYSKDWGSKGDSGATWNTVATLTGTTAVPAKMQKKSDKVFWELANGNPNADPVVIGADDNPNFTVRLSCNASSTSKKAYFDDFEIDGT